MAKGGSDGWGLILVLVVVLWLAAVGYFSVALAKGGEDKFADWDAVPCYITKVEVEDGFCRVRARIPSFDCTYYMVDPPNVVYDADGVVIGEENFDGTAACRRHYQDLVDRDGFAFNTTCYSDPESPGDQNCEVAISRSNARSGVQWALLVFTGIFSSCGFTALFILLCYCAAATCSVCRDACGWRILGPCSQCCEKTFDRTCGKCLGTGSHRATAGASSGGAVKVVHRDPFRQSIDDSDDSDADIGRSTKRKDKGKGKGKGKGKHKGKGKGKGKRKGKTSKRTGKAKPIQASSSASAASASEVGLAEASSSASSVAASASSYYS